MEEKFTFLTVLFLLILTLLWDWKLSFVIIQDTFLLRPSRKCFLNKGAYSFLSAFRWTILPPFCGSFLKTKNSLQFNMLTFFYPVIQILVLGGTRCPPPPHPQILQETCSQMLYSLAVKCSQHPCWGWREWWRFSGPIWMKPTAHFSSERILPNFQHKPHIDQGSFHLKRKTQTNKKTSA